MSKVVGERAVREYLAAVADPQSTVNQAAVDRAQRKLDKCDDPVAALDLFRDLEAAKTPDLTKLEEAFVKVAFRYAEAKGLPVEAFIAQGVSKDVLRRADFSIRAGKYKDRVTGDVVRDHILGLKDKFTIGDVAGAVNASEAGARTVILELVDEGKVECLGPVKTGRPGKPSVFYEVV